MIGLTHGSYIIGDGLNSFKRDALFFDQISVISCNATIEMWRNGPYSHKGKYQYWADEAEYLIELGVVNSTDQYRIISESDVGSGNREYYGMCTQLDEILKEINSIRGARNASGLRPIPDEEWKKLEHLSAVSLNLQLRIAAEEYKVFSGENAYSIVSPFVQDDSRAGNVTQGDVLSLCLDQVPIPEDDTPWEQIFEMRSDEDLIKRARKLKLWTQDIANQGGSLEYVNEYLQDLLSDYERYMRLHTKKFQRGIVETTLVGTAEIIEDLVKIRLGSLVKKAFEIKKQQCDLLIAEMEAPGREVSLITKLNEIIG